MDLELKLKIGWLREKYDHPREESCEELDDRISRIKAEIALINFKLGRVISSPNDKKYVHQSSQLESSSQPKKDEHNTHDSEWHRPSYRQKTQQQPSQPSSSPFQTALRQGAGLNQTSRRSTKRTGKSFF